MPKRDPHVLLNEPELVVRTSFEPPDGELMLFVGSPSREVNCTTTSARKKVDRLPEVDVAWVKSPGVLAVTLTRDKQRTFSALVAVAESIYIALVVPKQKLPSIVHPLDDLLW